MIKREEEEKRRQEEEDSILAKKLGQEKYEESKKGSQGDSRGPTKYTNFTLPLGEKKQEIKYSGWLSLVLKKGDITEAKVEGITNAANSGLQHYGGIAGALLKKCGP